jgi:prepilin-type processing-associated H-X9-DG protein
VKFLVGFALIAFLAAYLCPLVERQRQSANLALCKDHLRQVGADLRDYAQLNGGFLPVAGAIENPHADVLAALAAAHCAGDPRNYYCPSQTRPDCQFTQQNFQAGNIGYFYYGAAAAPHDPALSRFLLSGLEWPRDLNLAMDGNTWVMSDMWFSGQETAHTGYRKGLNYLMLDGSVDFVGQSPRQAFH